MKHYNSDDERFRGEVLNAAKAYIAKGWHVFPLHSIKADGECTCGKLVCSDAGKHPRLSRGLKEASADPQKIEEWFEPNAPLSNLGIVTGAVSGCTVLDIDTAQGKGGDETWAEIVREHGEPQTLTAKTGSGGFHLLFAYNSALKTATNVLGKGIDCRNDGGYVVAAPSRHRSGGVYSWMNEGESLAVLPAHLSRRKEGRGRPRKGNPLTAKYTLGQVREMLAVIPADDRDFWRAVGIVLGREFNRADGAFQVYVEWANKWGGKKGRNHDAIQREAFYEISQQGAEKELSIGTVVHAATKHGWVPKKGEVSPEQFVYVGESNNYLYKPTLRYWTANAVDVVCSPVNVEGKIIKAGDWIKEHIHVTSLACDPSIPDGYIKGKECRNGEIAEDPNAAVFNLYRSPVIELGDARLAEPFVRHVRKVFPHEGDADQFLDYMAHRVKKPWEKPRFALLIAGGQGTGKDTAITMCAPAIGEWNVANIDPAALQSNFNEYATATLVRISEAANLHDMNKFVFNEQCKVLIAGNPDHVGINPKYGQKFSVRMHCGVIITTNHLASGIYLPADDRRYDVIESARLTDMGLDDAAQRREYFSDLWDWFLAGGASHVAAYLHERDISRFSASNGQRKTEAHHSVVQIGRERHAWLYDILEELGHAEFVSFPSIREHAKCNGEDIVNVGAFNGRAKAALEDAGYVKYRNTKSRDGRWYKTGHHKGFFIYAKIGTPQGLDPRELVKASSEFF